MGKSCRDPSEIKRFYGYWSKNNLLSMLEREVREGKISPSWDREKIIEAVAKIEAESCASGKSSPIDVVMTKQRSILKNAEKLREALSLEMNKENENWKSTLKKLGKVGTHAIPSNWTLEERELRNRLGIIEERYNSREEDIDRLNVLSENAKRSASPSYLTDISKQITRIKRKISKK